MNYFKNLFNLKKTKMIDEAVFFHRPVTMGKSIITFFVVMIIANLLVAFAQSIPLIIYLVCNEEFYDLIESYIYGSGNLDGIADIVANIPPWLSAVTILLSGIFIFVAVFYCKKYESRDIATMGIRKKDCVPEYLVGFLIGGGMIGLSLLLSLAFGSATVSFNSFSPYIFLFLIAFMVQGFAHSTFVGGYFTVSLARDYSPVIAVSVGAVAFSLFYTGGTGFTVVSFINILLLGFFLGVYMFKRGSIIGCSAILAGWGFMDECIFNGSASLLTTDYSVGSVYVNGGGFGAGGGLCATLVLVIGIFLLLLTKTKKSELSEFETDFN